MPSTTNENAGADAISDSIKYPSGLMYSTPLNPSRFAVDVIVSPPTVHFDVSNTLSSPLSIASHTSSTFSSVPSAIATSLSSVRSTALSE